MLDPFSGVGTTPAVCKKLNRNFIGFEINPDYIAIAKQRIQQIEKSTLNTQKTENQIVSKYNNEQTNHSTQRELFGMVS